jgi:hypothetical protein
MTLRLQVRTFVPLLAGAALLAGSSLAQAPTPSASAALPPLPRAFAGYGHPAIAPSACRAVSAAETQCVIPAMTAGRYLIEAAATSTAQAAGAAQALQIVVAGDVCGVAREAGTWTSGARTFRFDCAVTLLADQPVPVRVIYADEKAAKDPKGPAVTITALPWNGVMGALPFAPHQ